MIRVVATIVVLACQTVAHADTQHADSAPSLAPDIRKDESRLKIQDGNFVAVPIPMANPTLDAGLIGAAAYFYPQTEEQKKQQPASATGLAAMYTANESWAFGGFHQAYWNDDAWRFTGTIGAADLRLSLISPEESESRDGLNWRVKGAFLNALLLHRIVGDWYVGGRVRVVEASQSIETRLDGESGSFDLDADTRAAGVGIALEYDTRDIPTGPHSGRQFKADGLFNTKAIGSSDDYETYTLAYKSYHRLSDSLVLAWEMRGCYKDGEVPLWDACRIPLRGFAAFDYLGQSSLSGQAELRWRAYKRLGLVAFGGGGWAGRSFSTAGDDESTPSLGAGIRYEVLPAKRLNMRLDLAWSDDSEGIYLSVGEAF